MQRWLNAIGNLPFNQGGRYLDAGDTGVLCCWPDPPAAGNQRLRFGTIRRSGLPLMETQGNLTDLNIPAQSGLAEQTHIVCFPNNVIGAEVNFYGPRINRLGWYLHERAGVRNPESDFLPLPWPEVTARLAALSDIRLLGVTVLMRRSTPTEWLASLVDLNVEYGDGIGWLYTEAGSTKEEAVYRLLLKVRPE